MSDQALSATTEEFSKDWMLNKLMEVGTSDNTVMITPADKGYNILFRYDSEVPIKAWVRGVQMEDEAQKQLLNIASMPIVHHHVAAMPDVHWGMGATVGSVIPTKGAIIPAAVGVDIGCGMMAMKTSLTGGDLPVSLKAIRDAIERAVPHGRTNNGGPGDRGAWSNVPASVQTAWEALDSRFKAIGAKHPKALSRNTMNHLGTLGTGNHFIEVCLDTEDNVWIMLHSGSRGLGNRFGTYFIEKAQEDMLHLGITLIDKDLSYLREGTPNFNDYVEAVMLAQDFARINRQIMMQRVLGAVRDSGEVPPFQWQMEAVNCHHNYVSKETHYGQEVYLTRKGAVHAGAGELGIIPGSMGARSYIVRGRGNAESFNSCSHGAGRSMSRKKAKATFSLEDHAKATSGIECRKDADVIDETPGAYKDIDAVMAAQADLVDIVHQLRQVICVKG
jgi:tRNA-splicing ligase RtcB